MFGWRDDYAGSVGIESGLRVFPPRSLAVKVFSTQNDESCRGHLVGDNVNVWRRKRMKMLGMMVVVVDT